MANTPESAYSPSDDELDDIINDVEQEAGVAPASTTDTDDREPAVTSPADDADNLEDDDEPLTQAEGEDDEEGDDDGQPAATAAAPTSAIPTTGAKPFQFKASGALHELPGALELPTGDVLIPKTALDDFRRTLASGQELRANFQSIRRDHERKLNQVQKQRNDKDIESDLIIKEWTAFLAMTPDERLDYAEQLDAKKPELELAIQREKLERDKRELAEQRDPSLTMTDEEKKEARQAAYQRELDVTYAELMKLPSVKALPQDKVAKIFAKHSKRIDRLIVKGEKPGEELFDDTDVRADLETLYELTQAQAAAAPPSKTPTPAERNARRNADVNAIPPVVRQRSPRDDGTKVRKDEFKGDRRKFRDAFMAGDLDG